MVAPSTHDDVRPTPARRFVQFSHCFPSVEDGGGRLALVVVVVGDGMLILRVVLYILQLPGGMFMVTNCRRRSSCGLDSPWVAGEGE